MTPHTFDRDRLSTREDAILELAIEGLTDIQIAQKLDITQSTVNSYWVRIRGKLGQLSRTELVALALKEKSRRELAEVRAQLEVLEAKDRENTRLASDYANVEIFRAALDAMPEATFVTCAQGVVRFANARMEAMFGYGEGELVGQDVSILVPGNVRTRERQRMLEYLKAPRPMRLGLNGVVYGQRRDGSLFRIVLLLDARETSAGPIATCVVRDFTSEIDQRREFVGTWVEAKAAAL